MRFGIPVSDQYCSHLQIFMARLTPQAERLLGMGIGAVGGG
jgi:hypothetical protein